MIDAGVRTLHIRCGSDIRDKLLTAGFSGDFLEYSDPVCEGPVPDVPDLITCRARYLTAGAGRFMGFTETQCLARLRDAEQRLAAAHHYQRVVLWFEHDSYDQLVLARCLSRLAEGPLPDCLELICIDRHPDVPRFNGLGQLEPAALAGLWPARRPVTPAQIALGQAIWAALRQLTQRLVLAVLAEGSTRIGRIFAAMVNGREPLVFMGDIGLLVTVEEMARTDPPVLTIEPGDQPFPRVASITDVGRQVSSGTIDYLSVNPPERWLGGVRIAAGQRASRFDEAAGRIRMK
jgi:hypothetical protein